MGPCLWETGRIRNRSLPGSIPGGSTLSFIPLKTGFENYFLALVFSLFFRGLSQYGDLHFGHTFGARSLRGAHLCPHLSQRYPDT
jgi:hypothetical protein